jgi:ribosomal protein uS7
MTEFANAPKLFNRWTFEGLEVDDISLTDYIAHKNAVYLPHTAARYAKKRFRKVQCPIIERLVCALMFHGRNSGKKLLAVRIVRATLELIHLMTDENPIQVVVSAVANAGPRCIVDIIPSRNIFNTSSLSEFFSYLRTTIVISSVLVLFSSFVVCISPLRNYKYTSQIY